MKGHVKDDDRAASLSGSSMLSSGHLPLTEILTCIARFAVQAVAGADGAGLTLLEPDRADALVTGAFAARVDAAQYGLGEGTPAQTRPGTGSPSSPAC